MSFIYLAQPYTHKDESVRAARFRIAERMTALYTDFQEIIYSPIVHSHRMAIVYSLPSTADYWEKANTAFLEHASAIRVLEMPGWEKSAGLAYETEWWKTNRPNVPIQFVPWSEMVNFCSDFADPDGHKPLQMFLEIASKV